MKTQHLQSLQHRNAAEITKLHDMVKTKKILTAGYYTAAWRQLNESHKLTATIKKLAANQVAIKKDIKGSVPKRARVKKPDSRVSSVPGYVAMVSSHNLPIAAQTAP